MKINDIQSGMLLYCEEMGLVFEIKNVARTQRENKIVEIFGRAHIIERKSEIFMGFYKYIATANRYENRDYSLNSFLPPNTDFEEINKDMWTLITILKSGGVQ